MAVGTMTVMSRGFLNLNGPPVTLSTRRANATDVLMLLADMGGYGFAVVPDSKSCALGVAKEQGRMMLDIASKDSSKQMDPQVTLAFRGESYSRAFNAALRSAGWYGVREGRTIFAGPSVMCDSLGQQITKVIRLNQADPEAAVSYLATLGALGKRPNQTTVLTTSGPTAAERQPGQENKQQETKLLEIELYRSPAGPLLGLEASFDKRLGLVTLTGSPSVVAIAEQYLRKFDLRKRQVALSVAILDIDLNSDSSLASSFAYRSGQNFIVNDAGRLFANFGDTGQDPPFNIPDGDIVGFLRAQISSQNAKVLATPTLILQEGDSSVPVLIESSAQEKDRSRIVGAEINIGAEVITEFSVSTDSLGNNVCTPATKTAGLSLRASVDKIDDNGFVTFSVNPSISAPVGNQVVPGCGTINILNQRTLAGSNARVRDGQTLILTGVISDEDRTVVTKWPIFGDMPLIGSLFRSTGRARVKRELVILVTPRIVSDEEGGLFGYGYRPSSIDALRLISEPAMR